MLHHSRTEEVFLHWMTRILDLMVLLMDRLAHTFHLRTRWMNESVFGIGLEVFFVVFDRVMNACLSGILLILSFYNVSAIM